MGIYRDMNNGLFYSGAGVLVVEDYYTDRNTVVPCVLLVKNKASALYTDFGGAYETNHQSLGETARNELREESVNLFNINKRHFVYYVDIPSGKYFYRVYILKINGVSRKYYKQNKKLLDTRYAKGIRVPRSWRETDGLAHIPLKNIDFNKFNVRGAITVRDVDHKPITLHGRAKKAINYSYPVLLNHVNAKPLARKKDIEVYQSNNFLNGTISYLIK
jgi:hypothetical protein